jgi:hypothetical protein
MRTSAATLRKEWEENALTSGLAILDDSVWVALANEIIRIDVDSMDVVARVTRTKTSISPETISGIARSSRR